MKNRTKFILGGVVGVVIVFVIAMLTFPIKPMPGIVILAFVVTAIASILIVGVIAFAFNKNE
jgi:hypothetical protein